MNATAPEIKYEKSKMQNTSAILPKILLNIICINYSSYVLITNYLNIV